MKHAKRLTSLVLAALLPLGGALAQVEELSGTVTAGRQISIPAPFGGQVTSLSVREGQWVEAGDELAVLATTKVYAPIDGVVSGIEVSEGDALSGTVLSLQPTSRYTVSCSIDELYGTSDPERTYISLNETVYLRCVRDRSHKAVGTVTAVDGTSYTVDTYGGELYIGETVNVYRDISYAFNTWIGEGTVARASALKVEGEGSLLRLRVSEGQAVERGQLLFETADGGLDRYAASGNTVVSTAAGVVASVSVNVSDTPQKGDSIVTLYPSDGFQLAVTVPEDMITLLHTGDTLRFYLDWNEAEQRWYEGTVRSLSYVGATTAQNTTAFTAYVDFAADETVRLGMTAVVQLEVP